MNQLITLENKRVKLSPLNLDNYELLNLVASEHKLVQYSPTDIETPEAFKKFVQTALLHQEQKSAIPFIIYDKKLKRYAGCTRYMNIDWENKVLHIGSTWIGKEYQGSGLNQQIKILMLNHAYDDLAFEKVEFRVDERNIRSRKAVEKLGAQLEGILRKDVYLLDGYKRSTCCYGLLKEEWKTHYSQLK